MTKSADGARLRDNSSEPPERVPAVEWIAGLASLAILFGVLGTLGWRSMQPRLPPRIEVEIDGVRAEQRRFAVDVNVRNLGDEPVADLLVQGTLRAASGNEARVQARFDFVPGASLRRGTLLFDDDPREGVLDVRALGFREP